MSKEKIVKISGLNLSIAIFNIIIFSKGILDIKIIGGSAFQAAFGVTVIFISIGVFALGNYKLFFEKEQKIQAKNIITSLDCIRALKENRDKRTFVKDINILIEQIERLEKKKDRITEILLQKFSSSEMSYSKFQDIILEIERLFYLNMRSIINKINIFDEEEYQMVRKEYQNESLSESFISEKIKIYDDYISFVKDSIEDNEQILLKMDKLLLELSKFNSLEDGELEEMEVMKEVDELIGKIKFYK